MRAFTCVECSTSLLELSRPGLDEMSCGRHIPPGVSYLLCLYLLCLHCSTGDYLDRVRILPTAKLAKVKAVGHLEQRGVLRTNCIDCLDRCALPNTTYHSLPTLVLVYEASG